MFTAKHFISDEDGFVLSSEALLMGSIVVIGLLVGIDSIQNTVVMELGDYAESFGLLNQSYSYAGVSDGTASTEGTEFLDSPDDNDPPSINMTGPPASPDGET